jgi:(E)-4-hydroxy-3-methylbut-2-enyl-diphosphate synthase
MTYEVKIGNVKIGGGNPVVIQSMTNTNTADVKSTVKQTEELVDAGSEMVRMTVPNEESAKSIKEIKKTLLNEGYDVPIIGDFHYNGHILLKKFQECAEGLDKYRINPGNAGFGEARDENFKTFIDLAIEYNKPVRIGVNSGSLDQAVLAKMMDENLKKPEGQMLESEAVFTKAMVQSALQSAEMSVDYGLPKNNIILSVKISDVPQMISAYRELASKCDYALHAGVTEGGLGSKGVVMNTAGLSALLLEGIGDTIRVSMTFNPDEPRSREVVVAQEILQVLGLRNFSPMVTSCPGCGRTTTNTYRNLAFEVDAYLKKMTPIWRKKGFKGIEKMKVSVMGCIVNGPGEAKHASIGISLPGIGEEPSCPVIADGKQVATIKGDYKELSEKFEKMINDYVETHYR